MPTSGSSQIKLVSTYKPPKMPAMLWVNLFFIPKQAQDTGINW